MINVKKILRYAWNFTTKKKYRIHVKSVFDYYILEKQDNSNIIQKYNFLKNYKIFIIAGCELTYFKNTLSNFGINTLHTFDLKTSFEPLGEINNPNSRIWTFKPNIIVFSYIQKFRNIVFKIQNNLPELKTDEVKEFFNELEKEIIFTVKKTRSVYKFIPIYIITYPLTYKPNFGLYEYQNGTSGSSLIETLKNFDLLLYKLTRKIENLHVIDIEVAIQYIGKNKAIDKSCSNGIYEHLSKEGGKEVAHHFLNMLIQSEPTIDKIKCVVLDLDNTLWSGTLIEDGPENLSIKTNYLDLIEQLINRGIIVCICSKNNPQDEDLIGGIIGPIFDKLMIKKINWNPKSENIKKIAKELNIGLANIAFFDDSKFEREEVSKNAKGVKIFSNLDLFRIMSDSIFFTSSKITKESSKKNDYYKTQLIRKENENKSSSKEDYLNFLKSSSLELNIFKAKKTDLPRVFELLSKTNQMNLTMERTPNEKISEYFHNKNTTIFCFSLSDKFGEYGLVGTTIVVEKKDEVHIKEITLSCRAMGRDIEECMLIYITNFFKDKYQFINIKTKETEKNADFVKKLIKNDFKLLDKDKKMYQKVLRKNSESYPHWIAVKNLCY